MLPLRLCLKAKPKRIFRRRKLGGCKGNWGKGLLLGSAYDFGFGRSNIILCFLRGNRVGTHYNSAIFPRAMMRVIPQIHLTSECWIQKVEPLSPRRRGVQRKSPLALSVAFLRLRQGDKKPKGTPCPCPRPGDPQGRLIGEGPPWPSLLILFFCKVYSHFADSSEFLGSPTLHHCIPHHE